MKINNKISLNPEDYGIKSKDHCKLSAVWISRSKHSLTTAIDIIERSDENTDYDGYLWVVTTAYYSMFYMALAVLAKKGWKRIEDIGDTHKNVQNLFNSVFVINNIVDKKLYESYDETKNTSLQLLQYLSKGRVDRNEFQYESNKLAEKRIANKHLDNAKRFYETLSAIMHKIEY